MRNSRHKTDRKFQAVPLSGTYGDVVGGFIQEAFGPLKHAEKLLARAAKVCPRTAANWLRGECAPRGDQLLELMASCDALADLINEAVRERRCSRSSSN